jgi:Concanavalin A-like lectin/glucanases superfamily
MAAVADAATDRVSRATAPSLASITVMAWAKIGAVHAGNLFHPIMRVEAGGGTALVLGYKGTNGRTPSLYSAASTTGIAGTEIALGTYQCVAATMAAGSAAIFSGTTPGTLAKVTGTVNTSGTPDTVTLFSRSPSDGSEWLEGTLAYVRMWTAVLSDAEIALESQATSAVRTANLWADWSLAAAALTDGSGNSRTLTAGSTALAAATDPVLSTLRPASFFHAV